MANIFDKPPAPGDENFTDVDAGLLMSPKLTPPSPLRGYDMNVAPVETVEQPGILSRLNEWDKTALGNALMGTSEIGPNGEIINKDGLLARAPIPKDTVPGLGLEAAHNMLLGDPGVKPELDAQGNVVQGVGAPGDPGLPVPGAEGAMYDKKVGSTTTSTSTKERTPAAIKAEADAQKAAQDKIKAIEDEKLAVEELGKAQADHDVASAKADAVWNNAEASAIADARADITNYMAETDAKIAELAAQKPETFWGDKTGSDKIMAAISIGLGAMGQAMLGSGENVGMTLLKRRMDEFDAGQKRKFDVALKDIDNRRLNVSTKMQLMGQLNQEYSARKLAARAQVAAELGRGIANAKTAQTKAALGQKQAQVMQDAAKMRADSEAQYATQRNKTVQEDITKKVQQMPGMTRSGEPMNGEQSKNLGFYNQMRLSLENTKGIDDTSPEVRDALKQYSRDMQALVAAGGIPVGGKVVDYASLKGYGTALDNLKQRNPDAYNYVYNMNLFIKNKLRKESGAAIGADEYMSEFNTYTPSMNDSNKEILQKRKSRYQAAMDMYRGTGL